MACPSRTRSQTAGLLSSTTAARSPVGLPPASPSEVGVHYFPAFTVASNGSRGAASEIVAAVFGRAGYQTYYARDMLNNIGFVIFDTVQESTRIAGVSCPPIGNGYGRLLTVLRDSRSETATTATKGPRSTARTYSRLGASPSRTPPLVSARLVLSATDLDGALVTADRLAPVGLSGLFFYKKPTN